MSRAEAAVAAETTTIGAAVASPVRPKRKRGIGKIAVLLVVVAVVSALVGWSLAKIFSPPAQVAAGAAALDPIVHDGRV